MSLPEKLVSQADLDLAFDYFYSPEVQATNYRHLRFGQFIFNTYGIEIGNSYNEEDVYLAYGKILQYMGLLNSYLTFKKGLEDRSIKLPTYLLT